MHRCTMKIPKGGGSNRRGKCGRSDRCHEGKERDLSGYDLIGFASGVYYGKFHQTVLNFALANLPANKNVFLLCTCGGSAAFQSIEEVVKSKQGKVVGKFSCKGYDTFGPFKLIGGIAKGHPDDKDLADAVTFYKGIIQK